MMAPLILSEVFPCQSESKEIPGLIFSYGLPGAFLNTRFHTLKKQYQITSVANWDHKSGIIWAAQKPHRHHHLHQAMYEYGVSEIDRSQAQQGFMTAAGYFLDRTLALQLAEATQQMNYREGTVVLKKLYSENLW